jgi:hypothetical protein
MATAQVFPSLTIDPRLCLDHLRTGHSRMANPQTPSMGGLKSMSRRLFSFLAVALVLTVVSSQTPSFSMSNA